VVAVGWNPDFALARDHWLRLCSTRSARWTVVPRRTIMAPLVWENSRNLLVPENIES